MSGYKILLAGTAGVGKTTAIAAVSEIRPMIVDVRNAAAPDSPSPIAIGLNYGELTLPSGQTVRLYATPSQNRFDIAWRVLSEKSLGLIVLIDNSRPDPLGDLDSTLAGYKALIEKKACVIAISRMPTHPQPDMDTFASHLQSRGVLCPILPVDTRDSAQVMQLLVLVLLQITARAKDISEQNGWS
jgi:uncharacterized protein